MGKREMDMSNLYVHSFIEASEIRSKLLLLCRAFRCCQVSFIFIIMAGKGMVDPAIFAQLQQKIDEETTFRDVSEAATAFHKAIDH